MNTGGTGDPPGRDHQDPTAPHEPPFPSHIRYIALYTYAPNPEGVTEGGHSVQSGKARDGETQRASNECLRWKLVDNADILERWLRELGTVNHNPDPATIHSLERWAHKHRIDLVASAANLLATFNPDVHPRGHDGKFIEKFGIIKLLGGKAGGFGRKKDLTNQRGEVTEIIPDPKTPGKPTIRVKLMDGNTIDVKPDLVKAHPEKARLDTPLGQRQSRGVADLSFDDLISEAQSPDPARSEEALAEHQRRGDEYRAKSVDELNADLARLEGEGRDYRDEEAKLIVSIRNGKQSKAAQEARPPTTPEDAAQALDTAKKSMLDLVDSPDVQEAITLQRVQGQFGGSYLRDVEESRKALEAAERVEVRHGGQQLGPSVGTPPQRSAIPVRCARLDHRHPVPARRRVHVGSDQDPEPHSGAR